MQLIMASDHGCSHVIARMLDRSGLLGSSGMKKKKESLTKQKHGSFGILWFKLPLLVPCFIQWVCLLHELLTDWQFRVLIPTYLETAVPNRLGRLKLGVGRFGRFGRFTTMGRSNTRVANAWMPLALSDWGQLGSAGWVLLDSSPALHQHPGKTSIYQSRSLRSGCLFACLFIESS